MQSLKRQQGVVIVVALFIVALVATMAYLMMARLERDTWRTTLITRDVQGELYAQASITWAIDVLNNDLKQQKPNQLTDPIPIHSPSDNVNGYKVATIIYDMQSRYNINNLMNPDAVPDFVRLLQVVLPRLSQTQAQEIANNISYWVSPQQGQTETEKYYLNLVPPRRVAHRPMISTSELLLIKGVTPAIYQALQPYITTLPVTTQINVQTAEAPVLMTLSPDLPYDAAKTIESLRTTTPITSVDVFSNLDVVKNHKVQDDKIIVVSNYFLVETQAAIDKQKVVLYTLLERSQNGNKPETNILWQSKGVW